MVSLEQIEAVTDDQALAARIHAGDRSAENEVVRRYSSAECVDIPAGYDPETNTASFGGPLNVLGGEGRFVGATGRFTIGSKILFSLPVGTFEIEGVIKTAG